MNKTQLAKQFKVSVTTINAWLVKGCPHTRGKNGCYQFDRKQIETWRAETMPTRAKLSMSYSEARARKEAALAGLRELQLKQRQGELVEQSKVDSDWFKIGRQTRDGLFNIPDRVCAICASETDQFKIHTLLTTEITQALESLCHGK